MLKSFEGAHRQQFGFVVSDRALVIEAISVEGIGVTEPVIDPETAISDEPGEPEQDDSAMMYVGGATVSVPLYKHENPCYIFRAHFRPFC